MTPAAAYCPTMPTFVRASRSTAIPAGSMPCHDDTQAFVLVGDTASTSSRCYQNDDATRSSGRSSLSTVKLPTSALVRLSRLVERQSRLT